MNRHLDMGGGPGSMRRRVFLRVGAGGWYASAQNESTDAWFSDGSSQYRDKPSQAFFAIGPKHLANWNPTEAQEKALRQRLDEIPVNWELEVVHGGGLCYTNVTAQDEVIGTSSSSSQRNPVLAIFEALDDAGSKSSTML